MDYDSGFYCESEDGEILYAPNAVYGQGFEIFKELKASYAYPVHGWTWYDSGEEAFKALGRDVPNTI